MPVKKDEPMTDDERRADMLKVTQVAVGTGHGDRVMLGDDPRLKLPTISTDVPELDRILGGGVRLGRMGMVIGEASMGKTLITQWVIAAFQRRGMLCAMIDPEHTYDAEWFAKTGVDPARLIMLRPSCTEQAFDVACKWVEKKIDLIVMDSVAALVPKMRAEHTLEEREVIGLAARKLSEGMAQLTNVNTRTFVLFTNQLRSKVGVVYGSPDTIPGGRAQRFYMTYIIHARRAGWIPDTKDRQGYRLKMLTEKNKLAPPFAESEVPFMFDGTIDNVGGLIEMIKEFDVIEHKSGYFKWEGEIYHGSQRFKTFLQGEPESFARLQTLVHETLNAVPEYNEEVEIAEDPDDKEYNLQEGI